MIGGERGKQSTVGKIWRHSLSVNSELADLGGSSGDIASSGRYHSPLFPGVDQRLYFSTHLSEQEQDVDPTDTDTHTDTVTAVPTSCPPDVNLWCAAGRLHEWHLPQF